MPNGTVNARGPAMVYHAANNSLIVTTSPGEAFEMSIPTLVTPTGGASYDSINNITSPVQGLNAGTTIQAETEILNDTADDIEGETGNGFGAGGDMIIDGTTLYKSVWAYFDTTQQRSLFKTITDFSPAPTTEVSGPFKILSNTPASYSPDTVVTHWLNRMLVSIPAEWQAALGGDAAAGQFSAPLASVHSHGPNLHVFDLSDVGVTDPIPATVVLGYPSSHQAIGCDNCQATMTSTSTLWNEAAHVLAYAFINETATFITAGKVGTGDFCYGSVTDNPALHLTPHPSAPESETWCYSLDDGTDKGIYTYPYSLYFFLWDVNDFVAVKNGTMESWEVVPYEWFPVTMTHMPKQNQGFYFDDFAYDPTNEKLYLKHAQGGGTDGASSSIWGFSVNVAGGGGTPSNIRVRIRLAWNNLVETVKAWL